jgi:hypothetical protein
MCVRASRDKEEALKKPSCSLTTRKPCSLKNSVGTKVALPCSKSQDYPMTHDP